MKMQLSIAFCADQVVHGFLGQLVVHGPLAEMPCAEVTALCTEVVQPLRAPEDADTLCGSCAREIALHVGVDDVDGFLHSLSEKRKEGLN